MNTDKAIGILQAVKAGTADAFIRKAVIKDAIAMAIEALEKLEEIKNNEPPTSDWEVYSNRLYDAAYKRGYRDVKEDKA